MTLRDMIEHLEQLAKEHDDTLPVCTYDSEFDFHSEIEPEAIKVKLHNDYYDIAGDNTSGNFVTIEHLW